MTTTRRPASAAQIALIQRLMEERVYAGRTLDPTTMDSRNASNVIADLFQSPRRIEPNFAAVEPGYYSYAGNVFKVVQSRNSDRRYARRLHSPLFGHATWEYERGALNWLQAEGVRLTVEQAAEFGHLLGVCVICARTLTDPESVLAGIGPVCRTRL